MTSTEGQLSDGVMIVFKNKYTDGRLNVCGGKVQVLRKVEKWSQRELADRLQLKGLDMSKNAIQQIESGERFVTDIELKAIAALFGVSSDTLLS